MSRNILDFSRERESESTCYPATGCSLGFGSDALPYFWLICGRLELKIRVREDGRSGIGTENFGNKKRRCMVIEIVVKLHVRT